MIGAVWAWLTGSRAGRVLAAVVAVLAIIWGNGAAKYRKGRKDERDDQKAEDMQRAAETRRDANDARRRSAADPRDVDDRLREHGRLRD